MNKKIKENRVIFYKADNNMCYIIRIMMPATHLHISSNWEAIICEDMNEWNLEWLLASKGKKVAVFPRQYSPDVLGAVKKFKKNGVICVYESDDLMTNVPVSNPCYNNEKLNLHFGRPDVVSNTKKFISEVDHVIVSTEPLKREWLKYNKNISVIENQIDYTDYKISGMEDEFKIILTGSSSHVSDWKNITEAIKNLKIKTHVFGYYDPFIGCEHVVCHPWVNHENHIENLLKIGGGNSVGLCFLEENVFNEAKSNLKFLELSMANILVLANNFGPYKDLPIMYCKDRVHEICKKILKIKEMSKEEKIQRLLAQKEYVKKNYDINVNWVKWLNFFNGLS